MRALKVIEWELRLKKIFDEIDHIVEQEFQGVLPLHPCRPARGVTSNPAADGLFNIGASYTTGLGSEEGQGYAVEIRVSSLKTVSDELREQVNGRVRELLGERLKETFPENEMVISELGHGLKIHGDISVKG